MIIWLASYPKSGNTYVRAFLSAYYFSENGQFNFNQILNIDQFPHEKYFQEFTNNFRDINQNKKVDFFNLGPDNNWENLLNKDIRNRIEKKFKSEMTELKYLK